MKSEVGDLIEKWMVILEECRKDKKWIEFSKERDLNKEKALKEMNDVLKEYLSGKITIEEFRDMFHRKTFHEWSYFGLKGLSGAMFFNTLVKYIPDEKSLDSHFKSTIILPMNEDDGRTKMRQFFSFLNDQIDTHQIDRRYVQPARIPFFFSAWWHLQDPELWPIFYPEIRNLLENEGLFSPSDDAIENYFVFREVYSELRKNLGLSPWGMINFLTYLDKRDAIPDEEKLPEKTPITKPVETEEGKITHTQVQWMLAKIGKKLGCNVWIAKNDRNNEYHGERLGDFSIEKFPEIGMERSVQNKLEYIDVVWFKGTRRIVAAFEVEHTTSIISGILRLSDLTIMSPNLNFTFYIIVPENRLQDVRNELSRPTFQNAGLNEMCGFFSEELLAEKFKGIIEFADKPTSIERLAEKVTSTDW